MTDSSSKNETPVTFLHESQLEGKANEKDFALREKMSLDEALGQYFRITKPEGLERLKEKGVEGLDPLEIKLYCQDCRRIVVPTMGETNRGNPRTICGVCHSKKVSSGTEKGLIDYYRIKKGEEEALPASQTPPEKPSRRKKFSRKRPVRSGGPKARK